MTNHPHRSPSPKLRRLYYGAYEIVTGPAAGTVIERSTNPHALPCFRWTVIDGPSFPSTSGFRLRGLAAACDAAAAANVARDRAVGDVEMESLSERLTGGSL